MKHFWIKFNCSVELGAALAYWGHYLKTKDPEVMGIYSDERAHRDILILILSELNETPSVIMDFIFKTIGTTISYLCYVSPIFALNLIARLMEKFAIMNYNKLAAMYPQYSEIFHHMAITEISHEEYFKTGQPIREFR